MAPGCAVRLRERRCGVAWLWVRAQSMRAALRSARADRGDVPGFVMVTVMTAGLVVAVFAVFREAILEAVRSAIDGVVAGTGG
jgi:hypothetical protein